MNLSQIPSNQKTDDRRFTDTVIKKSNNSTVAQWKSKALSEVVDKQ